MIYKVLLLLEENVGILIWWESTLVGSSNG
jgi:hypothetical protein